LKNYRQEIVKLARLAALAFACATALVDATSKVDGLPVADLVGWLLVAVVLFAGIPLIAVLRRRRAAGADMTDLAEHG